MSIPIGAGPHGHGHAHAHGLGRQNSPAWQARAADPAAKGSAFGALVSQIAQGDTGGATDPSTTPAAGDTETTTPPASTASASTTPPASTTLSAPTGDPPAPGSTVDIQV